MLRVVVVLLFGLGCTRVPVEELQAPYVPTPTDVVRVMLDLADVGEEDLVYDLGSGDGRIVVAAARDFGARAVGFEIDETLVAQAREAVREAGLESRARIEEADIFELDLRPASVVTLYLLQVLNDRLVPQLSELAPGSRVVSHQYRLRGLRPRKELRLFSEEDGRNHLVFLYVLPFEGQPRFGVPDAADARD